MAIVTTATIQAALSWTQTDTPDVNNTTATIIDSATISYVKNLSSGTGSMSVDQIWHNTTGVLASGATQSYDLTNINRSIFGSTLDSSLTGIKALIIDNQSSGNGSITISATGTNGFTGPFNGAAGTGIAPPISPYIAINYVDGWTLNGTNNTIQLNNSGGSGNILYRIGVIGTKP